MSHANARAAADRESRHSDDFKFLVIAASKGNMGFYNAFRDKALDTPLFMHPPQGPESAYENR